MQVENTSFSFNDLGTRDRQDWINRFRGGEEGQPQQFLVRATFSPFYRQSHLGILVLRLLCVLKFQILKDNTIFLKIWSWA